MAWVECSQCEAIAYLCECSPAVAADCSESPDDRIKELTAENAKLKQALLQAIPWIGEKSTGPEWATSDAKIRNKQMCDEAFQAAADCFPAAKVPQAWIDATRAAR